MSLNCVLSDSIARIKNAVAVKHESVILIFSKFVVSVLVVLKNEGYISNFEIFEERKGINYIKVDLKYYKTPTTRNSSKIESVINKMEMVSKPGCRIYSHATKIPRSLSGLGIVIISTNQGVMPDYMARSKRLGGEVLFKIF